MTEQTVFEIDLVGLLHCLKRKIMVILGITVLCGVFSFIFSSFWLPQEYVATTRVYVLGRSETNGVTSADFALSNYLVSDLQVLITGRNVTDVVVDTLELDMSQEELAGKIRVSAEGNTRVLQISVTDVDAILAAEIANCVREVGAEQIKRILEIDAVNLVYEAKAPDEPTSPNVMKITVLGAAVGLILSTSTVSVRFFMIDSVKRRRNVA